MKKNILFNFYLTASLVATLVVVGCAQDKSDPIKDYRGLKTTPTRTQADTSQAVEENPFIVELPDTIPDFIEGQANSIQVRVRSRDPGITFSLAVNQVDLPKGATWNKVKDESPQSQLWVLKWTPPLRYTGLTDSTAPISIPMQAKVESAANPKYRTNNVYPVTINTVVRKSSTVPSVKFVGLQTSIQEGKSFTFTMEVTDPASSKDMPPKVVKFGCPQVNGEQPIEDGYNQVVANGVSQKGNGVWSYQYTFDTKNQTVVSHVPKATRTTLCFGFNVESTATRNVSTNNQRTVDVALVSKTPLVSWQEANPVFHAATPEANNLVFTVRVPSERGEIEVFNKTVGFATFPGKPSMNCKPLGSETNAQKCEISWKMSCSDDKTLKSKYVISISARNTFEGFKTDMPKPEIKEISVVKCESPAPPSSSKSTKVADAKGVQK